VSIISGVDAAACDELVDDLTGIATDLGWLVVAGTETAIENLLADGPITFLRRGTRVRCGPSDRT